MDNNKKTKDQLIKELRKAGEALAKAKNELEEQDWGIKKTNNAIRSLYSELEEKNKKLQDLDKLKSDFVSTVSHELRTPLATTKDAIILVLDELPGKINEKQKTILNIAKNNINRLERIINNILDVSKIEAGKVELKRETINIADLVKQIAASFESKIKQKGLELKVNVPDVNVYVDQDKMPQIFSNLIANAIKFTEKGRIEISVAEKEKTIECTVRDTGKGIPKKDIPRVFGKFQQFARASGAEEKGTGLGLSIVRSLIELHRGGIWFESFEGKGTEFTFTIPKCTAKALFRDYVADGIKKAIQNNEDMSIIVASLSKPDELKKKLSAEDADLLLKDIEDKFNKWLNRSDDIVIRDNGEISILLPDCDKACALRVIERLKQNLQDYLAQQDLGDKIKARFNIAAYPEDAKNGEGLINVVSLHPPL